jgi:chaperonin GroES
MRGKVLFIQERLRGPERKKLKRTTGGVPMKVRPLHDRILVERVEEEEKTKSGIFIPDSAKEKPQKGKVIAVGAGKINEKGERVKLDIKEGDSILFQKYGGDEIKVDGKELMIMREEDVLAVIEA